MILPLGSLGYVRKLRPLIPCFFQFFLLKTMYSVAFPTVLPGMEELNTLPQLHVGYKRELFI